MSIRSQKKSFSNTLSLNYCMIVIIKLLNCNFKIILGIELLQVKKFGGRSVIVVVSLFLTI